MSQSAWKQKRQNYKKRFKWTFHAIFILQNNFAETAFATHANF